MRVLVTGGNGFIGSHVLRQLAADGHAVTCLDVSGPSPVSATVADDVTHRRGDVSDPAAVYAAVASAEPDRIIDLASLLGRESQADPRRAVAVNLQGTVNVLEAAADLGVERVVTASSVASYGTVSEGAYDYLDETVPQQPRNIYGLTKYAAERIGETFHEQRDVEFAAIEPVHGVGPDRNRGNVEDAFIIKAAVSGTPLAVPELDRPVELIYVGDEASAFVAAALADAVPHSQYVIGTGELVTLADIVDLVRERVPAADIELVDPAAGEQFEYLPPTDTSRIREDLGWEPTLSVAEAVAEYVDWLEANPDAWSFDPAAVPWDRD